MFAALGRSAYRRRKLIVVLWTLAFAAGLVASLSVAAQLKGGGFTNPSSPSQQGQRQMQDRLGFGPASLTIVFSSDSLQARSPEFRRQVEDGALGGGRRRPGGAHRRPHRVEYRRRQLLRAGRQRDLRRARVRRHQRGGAGADPGAAPGAQAHAAHHPPDRRPRRVRRARAALRRGPADGRDLHHPGGDPRARAHLRHAGGRRPAGDRRRHGRHRDAGPLLADRPGARHLGLRAERRDAARPRRGHRLRAVHGRPVPRRARRRPERGRGGRDDGGHRRPLHLLQRSHRRRGPARPHDHPVHVAALDGPGRRARRARQRARRPDAAAGVARPARAARERTPRHRAQERRRRVLAPVERLGDAASGAGADRDHRARSRVRLAGARYPVRHPGRDGAAARLRVAAGLRPAPGALRRGGALAGRGPRDLERRGRPVRAGEPRAPVRLRAGAGGAPRRGPRHEHRDAAGHGLGRRRGRVLEGGRGRRVRDPRRGRGVASGRLGPAGPRAGHARRRADQRRPEARRGHHGARHGPLSRRARGAADLRGGPGSRRGHPRGRRPAGHAPPTSPAPP